MRKRRGIYEMMHVCGGGSRAMMMMYRLIGSQALTTAIEASRGEE